MEEEHLRSKDSGMVFLRTMNQKEATPMEEWEIVVRPVDGKVYTSKRTIGADNSAQPIAVYYAKMAEKNRELRDKAHAELIEVEVVGARLYTGPMFEKYNLVLRFHTGKARYPKADVDAAEEATTAAAAARDAAVAAETAAAAAGEIEAAVAKARAAEATARKMQCPPFVQKQ
jgi:hypothetical protein